MRASRCLDDSEETHCLQKQCLSPYLSVVLGKRCPAQEINSIKKVAQITSSQIHDLMKVSSSKINISFSQFFFPFVFHGLVCLYFHPLQLSASSHRISEIWNLLGQERSLWCEFKSFSLFLLKFQFNNESRAEKCHKWQRYSHA